MSSQPQARNSQRTVLACTECVRRKIRCSKTIPCTGCVRQNKAHLCQREAVAVTARRRLGPRGATPRGKTRARASAEITFQSHHILRPDPNDALESNPRATAVPVSPDVGVCRELAADDRSISHRDERAESIVAQVPGSYDSSTPGAPLTDESASALEFLAHGRKNVLRRFRSANHQSPSTMASLVELEIPFDPVFPFELCHKMLEIHQTYLTWMHTVVHMPTFMHEFEMCLLTRSCDRLWAALYYAILAHTLYHLSGSPLLPDEVLSHVTSNVLFDKSVDMLYQGNFMSEHKTTSVQTICLLVQVAHNLDKSDLVCILVSTAIRISQCLNLHLLGSDTVSGLAANTAGPRASNQNLIEREIEKRIWWFLVRYDWLQIPFQNICQIQPAQFNTPMPLDCFDEPERMVQAGAVVSQRDYIPTSTRWTVAMDQVSIVIWKHQDRMNKAVNRGNGSHTPENIYEHVIWADGEIKRLYAKWPVFMREVGESEATASNVVTKNCLPVTLMPGLSLLCVAHKVLGVHRQFQLSSFRDRRFAFTQMSCVSIVERALTALQAWPDTAETHIVRRMWTTVTQVLSCCVALVFVLLFKNENENALLYDTSKIRGLLSFATDFLRREERTSSIAARGAKLIGALADLEWRAENSGDIEAEMSKLVQQFAANDDRSGGANAAEVQQIVFPPTGQDFWDIFSMGGNAFSEYLMDQDFQM